MRRLLTFTLLLLGANQTLGADSPREVLDVRYRSGGGSRHTLDVFVPREKLSASARRPVVLFVHGGTWMAGDKNFFGMYRGVGRFLARHGVVAVLTNYRLSPLVRHPEHIKDVAAAYAWCHRNITRYGGDADNIILAGHSAGAHLVSLLATDLTYLKDPALELDERARKAIKGVVAVSGVFRIPAPAEFNIMARRTVDHLVGVSGSNRLAAPLGSALMMVSDRVNPFGIVFGRDRDVQVDASPIHHIRPGIPPFLVLNAEREVAGLHDMADDFVAALKKHRVPVDRHIVDGVTHRTIVKKLHDDSDEAGKMVLAFVSRLTGKAG
ncbi:MAG: alpha/beta hydrolase [Gemmataceae bacterium]